MVLIYDQCACQEQSLRPPLYLPYWNVGIMGVSALALAGIADGATGGWGSPIALVYLAAHWIFY